MSNIEKIISESPFITEVKRSAWVILSSIYYKPMGTTEFDVVLEAEQYVLENGIFIGAMSKHGFFMCEDVDDVIDSFWLAIAYELDVDTHPGKIFIKKIKELYEISKTKFS